MKKFLLVLFLLIILTPVFFLGYLGVIPGLSSLFGSDKPRDLGIKYSETDLKSIRGKSHAEYKVLPDSSDPGDTRHFSGSRALTADFTSAEITSTVNNQPWKYWPYKNIQVKFNADGSTEVSGILMKNKVPGYAAAIGIPKEAIDFAMKYLPESPVFYVKGKAGLTDNKVSLFEPRSFEIGRMPMPLDLILAIGPVILPDQVYAQDIKSMGEDLSKVKNKREMIISYINSRLSTAFGSFYAKKAYIEDSKLKFEGTISDKISYTP